MSQCIIIDPCLFRMGGHEYAMNEFLCKQASSYGYNPIVLCNNQFQEQASFPYRPIFTYSPYASTGVSPKKDKELFLFGNRDVYSMLQKHFPIEEVEKDSMFLIHTACATILGGVARWLGQSARTDLSVRIVLRWGVAQRHSSLEIGIKLHQTVLRQFQKQKNDVRTFVDSSCLKKHYMKVFKRDYAITPIGVDFAAAPKKLGAPNRKECLRFVFT